MKAYVLSYGAVQKDWRYPDNDPDDKKYRRRLLAEGDSWFSLGGVPIENLLFGLDFPERTIVVNIAEPGDTILRIGNEKHAKVFKRFVCVERTAYAWNAILVSGGGNDLIASAGAILKNGNSVESCIKQNALDACMRDVAAGFRALAALRDAPKSVNADCLMIAHTYDYPTPRNSPALFYGNNIQGPWLYDSFVEKQIPEDLWIPVSDFLLDALAETILNLASGPKAIPNFRVVNTRGTIIRAELNTTKKSGDWRNEIHPSKDGFAKLARKVAAALP